MEWTPLRVDAGDVLVVPRSAVLPSDPASVACLIDDALAHPEGRAAFARWLDVEDDLLEEPEVRARAIALITDGYWRAIEVGHSLDSGGPGGVVDPRTDPKEPRDPDRPRGPTTELTWVSIALLDEDGAPVPDARYRLTLPDGVVTAGRLDFDGALRRDRIPSGSCHVEFPDLDAAPGVAAPRTRAQGAPLDEPTYEVAPDHDEPEDDDEPVPPVVAPSPEPEPEVDDDDLGMEE